MAHSRSILPVIVALSLATIRPAPAADRFVDGVAGSDTANDCLGAVAPCRTIGRALASAQSGDTIKVVGARQLKYHEVFHLVASTTLTFVGGYDASFSEPPDPVSRPTVIDAQKRDRIFTLVAGPGETLVVTVDGFTMRKGLSTTNLITEFCCIGKGGGIAALADAGGSVDLTVRNSIVTKCRSDDSAGGIVVIGFAGGVATVHLNGVTVTRNRAPYGGGIGLQAINVGGPSVLTATIENSIIAGNRTEYDGGGVGVGAHTSTTSNVRIVNSTITGNRTHSEHSAYGEPSGGGGLSLVTGAGGTIAASVSNTIIRGNGARAGTGRDLLVDDASSSRGITADVDHTDLGDVQVNSGTVNDLGGNLDVTPGTIRFHLEPGSPLIDAGTCAGAPATDIDGDPRPSGAGCDIGADEFVP